MGALVVEEHAGRWQQEAAFFDALASRAGEGAFPLDPLALARYTRRRLRSRFSMEYRFRLLGPLAGLSLLDVGCGEGLNSVLLAKLGAEVTGVDVSKGAIEVAQRRAMANGVAERTRFVCAPLELAEFKAGSFDIVWGDGILHHVLPELRSVLERLVGWARPGGLFVFSEPIQLSPLLGRLRRLVPVKSEGTPGERPLVRSELELVRGFLPDLQVRRFAFFTRLERFVLTNCNYERSSLARRAAIQILACLDAGLLRLPGMEDMAGTCVMHARRP